MQSVYFTRALIENLDDGINEISETSKQATTNEVRENVIYISFLRLLAGRGRGGNEDGNNFNVF